MKISDILNPEKTKAVRGEKEKKEKKKEKQPPMTNAEKWEDDIRKAKEKGISVSKLLYIRRRRKAHRKNRKKRLQELKRQKREEKQQ